MEVRRLRINAIRGVGTTSPKNCMAVLRTGGLLPRASATNSDCAGGFADKE
jgi:hypothetical protein